MSDFDDDFGDYDDGGFGDDDSMGDDAMEDRFEEAMPGDDLDDPDGQGDEMTGAGEAESDGFTGRDAIFLGGAMGWAYEEGQEEAEVDEKGVAQGQWKVAGWCIP